jgi:hypothetical protein
MDHSSRPPALQLISRQQDEPTPTWPKDDRIPDHDIIRLRSSRDPSRRVGLESSEISDETSSCGRRLCFPGGLNRDQNQVDFRWTNGGLVMVSVEFLALS